MSIDFRGNPHSSILDAPYTKVMDGDFVKVLAWYDNEWGYSSRCVDLLRYIGEEGPVGVADAAIKDLDLDGQAGASSASTSTCRSRTARSPTTRASARRCRRSRYALEQGATVDPGVAPRPAEGQAEPGVQLRPVAEQLSQLLGRPVAFADGLRRRRRRAGVDRAAAGGGVMLLENLRFHPEEEKNDPAFAKAAGGAGRRLRQRRVRVGAPRARVDRGHRPSRQGGGGRAC